MTQPRPPGDVLTALGLLTVGWGVALAWRPLDLLVLALVGAVAMGALGVWLLRRHDLSLAVGERPWLAVPAAVGHLAVSYLAVPVAAWLLPVFGTQTRDLVDAAVGDTATWTVALVAGLLIAPAEELFWRGAVQPLLGAGRPPWARVGLATVAFVAFHAPTLELPLMGAALLGGLVWGWLREATGGMAAPVLAHAVWTATVVAVPPG